MLLIYSVSLHNKPTAQCVILNTLYSCHVRDCIRSKCCSKWAFLIGASEQREGRWKGSVMEKCIRGSINVNHNEGWGDKEATEIKCRFNFHLSCLTSIIGSYGLHCTLDFSHVLRYSFELSYKCKCVCSWLTWTNFTRVFVCLKYRGKLT